MVTKWKRSKIMLLLGKDERLAKKLKATIRISFEWGWTVRETVGLLSLWKQPFPSEFKKWVKRNVRSKRDLQFLQETIDGI